MGARHVESIGFHDKPFTRGPRGTRKKGELTDGRTRKRRTRTPSRAANDRVSIDSASCERSSGRPHSGRTALPPSRVRKRRNNLHGGAPADPIYFVVEERVKIVKAA